MKNSKYIIAIVLITAFVLMTVSCGKKDPATIEAFYQKTAEFGLQKSEVSIDDPELNAILKEKAFAIKESNGAVVMCEFYVATSAAGAASIFSGTKPVAETFVSGARSTSSITSGSYSYYRLASSDLMAILARIGDTVLYIRADKALAEDADGIAKALGYK